MLSTQSFSAFSAGLWASWNLTGHVRIQVTATAGANGVVNGIFF